MQRLMTISLFLLCLASLPCLAQNGVPVDLKGACNMAFKDEIDGDGKGGWTDQGGNDFRHMPLGKQTLCGVDFEIIDPAGNQNKSCIALKGKARDKFPESAKVEVGKKAGAIAFLHALGWGDDKAVAEYVIGYDDGSSETIPIRPNQEIIGWWTEKETENIKIGVQSYNLRFSPINVFVWEWRNPHPAKVIKEIEFKSTNSGGIPIIVAVTLLDQYKPLISDLAKEKAAKESKSREGWTWIEAEKWTKANITVPYDKKKKKAGFWENPAFSGDELMLYNGPTSEPVDKQSEDYRLFQESVVKLNYDFEVDADGEYGIWARFGSSRNYAPFKWNVDDGEWGQIDHQTPWWDMYQVSQWVTLGWAKLGTVKLDKGKHTLNIHVPRPGSESTDQQMEELIAQPKRKGEEEKKAAPWMVWHDCYIVSRKPFYPKLKYKPNEEIPNPRWHANFRSNSLDLTSADLGKDGVRKIFDLDGVWALARDPDPEPHPYYDVRKRAGGGKIDKSGFLDEEKFRAPVTEYKDPATLGWMAVTVPDSNSRIEQTQLNRRRYLKKIAFPKDLQGKRFSLHFAEANYNCSVFVNGKLVGTHVNGYVPFKIDITEGIKPGELNEIMVCVKGLKYYMNRWHPGRGDFQWKGSRAFVAPGYTGWHKSNQDGLGGSVWLETQGGIYGKYIFAYSKFKEKQVHTSVEVVNPEKKEFAGKIHFEICDPDQDNKVITAFGEQELKVPAGGELLVKAIGDAKDLEPWWPCPEKKDGKAKLYVIRSVIKDSDGKALDLHEDRFGFREVTIEDKYFRINGKRYNFRSLISGKGETMEEVFDKMREYNINVLRLPHSGYNSLFKKNSQKASVDYMDKHGIPIRFCSQLNGMFNDISMYDPLLWENCKVYFVDFIKGYRNHPSIMMWTMGNEVDLISNMAGKIPPKKFLWDAMKVAHGLDPSRGIMEDGAGDLLGEAEICNWHYPHAGPIADPNDSSAFGKLTDIALFPNNAYTFARMDGRNANARPWDKKRPLWVGETMFLAGKVSRWCWLGGDEPLYSRFNANDHSTEYLCMLGRGYRWMDTAGFNLFTSWNRTTGDRIKRTLAPVAVFPLEYNSAFFPGAKITRTLKIFNDTLDESPIQFDWTLMLDGKKIKSGSSSHKIEPGFYDEKKLEIDLPKGATKRIDGELVFALKQNGKEVFREPHQVSIIPRPAKLPVGKTNLMLYDPQGKFKPVFAKFADKFTTLKRIAGAIDKKGVLVIAPMSLEERQARDLARLQDFVAKGGRILILDQAAPVSSQAFPVKVSSVKSRGAFAFPRGTHPVLTGIKKNDLSCWADGHAVFNGAYQKENRGDVIVDSSSLENLDLAPVTEITWGNGSYLVSQLMVGSKAEIEPNAAQMLHNYLKYLINFQPANARLAILEPNQIPVDLILKEAQISCKKSRPKSEMDLLMLFNEAEIILADGNAKMLDLLLQAGKDLKKYCQKGGWVYLASMDKRGLSRLSKIIGEELIMRDIGMERLVLANQNDPMLRGVASGDLCWYQRLSKKEYEECKWMHGDYPLQTAVFTGALIYDDISGLSNNPSIYNHLTAEDFWPYISYGGAELKLDWRKDFEIHKVAVRESRHYQRVQELTLKVGKDDNPVEVREIPKVPRRENIFEFSPRKASTLSLKASKFKTVHPRGHGPFGWDTVKIYRTLSDSFKKKVIPLSDPAGIVKFPIGKGGILLNLVAMREPLGQRVFLQFLYNMKVQRGKKPAAKGEEEEKGEDQGLDLDGDDDDDLNLDF